MEVERSWMRFAAASIRNLPEKRNMCKPRRKVRIQGFRLPPPLPPGLLGKVSMTQTDPSERSGMTGKGSPNATPSSPQPPAAAEAKLLPSQPQEGSSRLGSPPAIWWSGLEWPCCWW